MKRFASNYLYIQSLGFIYKAMIEIDHEGLIHNILPLNHETSRTIWLPGVIMIDSSNEKKLNYQKIFSNKTVNDPEKHPSILKEINSLSNYKLIHFYPFNFEEMMPDKHTVHQYIDISR